MNILHNSQGFLGVWRKIQDFSPFFFFWIMRPLLRNQGLTRDQDSKLLNVFKYTVNNIGVFYPRSIPCRNNKEMVYAFPFICLKILDGNILDLAKTMP